MDSDTSKVEDLVPFTRTGLVTQWLSEFQGIETVSRDGSTGYGKAVSEAFTLKLQNFTIRPLIIHGETFRLGLASDYTHLPSTKQKAGTSPIVQVVRLFSVHQFGYIKVDLLNVK